MADTEETPNEENVENKVKKGAIKNKQEKKEKGEVKEKPTKEEKKNAKEGGKALIVSTDVNCPEAKQLMLDINRCVFKLHQHVTQPTTKRCNRDDRKVDKAEDALDYFEDVSEDAEMTEDLRRIVAKYLEDSQKLDKKSKKFSQLFSCLPFGRGPKVKKCVCKEISLLGEDSKIIDVVERKDPNDDKLLFDIFFDTKEKEVKAKKVSFAKKAAATLSEKASACYQKTVERSKSMYPTRKPSNCECAEKRSQESKDQEAPPPAEGEDETVPQTKDKKDMAGEVTPATPSIKQEDKKFPQTEDKMDSTRDETPATPSIKQEDKKVPQTEDKKDSARDKTPSKPTRKPEDRKVPKTERRKVKIKKETPSTSFSKSEDETDDEARPRPTQQTASETSKKVSPEPQRKRAIKTDTPSTPVRVPPPLPTARSRTNSPRKKEKAKRST